jgi:hypothetical protein
MKRLAILGVALAALATPAHAQSQQKSDAPVYSFNGNTFDPPVVEHHGAVSHREHYYVAPRAAETRAPTPAKRTPLNINGNIFD